MVRIGINGFGRMGRLALRAGLHRDDIEFVAINEPHATADTMAILLEFDSVQDGSTHHARAKAIRSPWATKLFPSVSTRAFGHPMGRVGRRPRPRMQRCIS